MKHTTLTALIVLLSLLSIIAPSSVFAQGSAPSDDDIDWGDDDDFSEEDGDDDDSAPSDDEPDGDTDRDYLRDDYIVSPDGRTVRPAGAEVDVRTPGSGNMTSKSVVIDALDYEGYEATDITTLTLAECWYKMAYAVDRTDRLGPWKWDDPDPDYEPPCYWTTTEWKRWDQPGVILQIQYGADFNGSSLKDTSVQARESRSRGAYMHQWAIDNGLEYAKMRIEPTGTLSKRKAEIRIMLRRVTEEETSRDALLDSLDADGDGKLDTNLTPECPEAYQYDFDKDGTPDFPDGDVNGDGRNDWKDCEEGRQKMLPPPAEPVIPKLKTRRIIGGPMARFNVGTWGFSQIFGGYVEFRFDRPDGSDRSDFVELSGGLGFTPHSSFTREDAENPLPLNWFQLGDKLGLAFNTAALFHLATPTDVIKFTFGASGEFLRYSSSMSPQAYVATGGAGVSIRPGVYRRRIQITLLVQSGVVGARVRDFETFQERFGESPSWGKGYGHTWMPISFSLLVRL